MLQVERMSGKRNPKLSPQVHPGVTADIYAIFTQLSRARSDGALRFSEIKAWSDLTDYKLDQTELQVIQVFDGAFLASKYEQARKASISQST